MELSSRINISGDVSRDDTTGSVNKSCVIQIPIDLNKTYPEHLTCSLSVKNDEFVKIATAVYKMCQVKADTTGSNYVKINFLQDCDRNLLEDIKTACPVFASVATNISWFYKLIYVASSVSSVRAHKGIVTQICEQMSKQDVNNEISRLYSEPAEDTSELTHKYTVFFNRYLSDVRNVLQEFYRKARLGVQFYYHCRHLSSDMLALKVMWQQLLSGLCNKSVVQKFSNHCFNLRETTKEFLHKYSSCGSAELNTKFKFIAPVRIHNNYNYETFKKWVEEGVLYNNILYVEDLQGNEIEPFTTWMADHDPLIKELKTIELSKQEIALQEFEVYKPEILRFKKDFESFLQQENKSTGDCNSMQHKLQKIERALDDLARSGADVSNAGVTVIELDSYRKQLFDTETEVKADIRKREKESNSSKKEDPKNAPFLTLSPLSDYTCWLNWKKEATEILDNYSNETTKKALIIKSLRDPVDVNACRGMDYHQIWSWLVKKYEDADTLIPLIVEGLLSMEKATNDYQTYQNLAKFQNGFQLLEYHKAERQLDAIFRRKMTPILLSREFFIIFQKDLFAHEEKIKLENNISDDVSQLESSVQSDFEMKRRDYWLKSIGEMYDFVRKLVMSAKKAGSKKPSSNNYRQNSRGNSNSYNSQSASSNSTVLCQVCSQSHSKNGQVANLGKCPKFRNMDYDLRKQTVINLKICWKCLRPKNAFPHPNGTCQLQVDKRGTQFPLQCSLCQPISERHHRLLHPPFQTGKVVNQDKFSDSKGGGGSGGSNNKGGKKSNYNKKSSYLASSSNTTSQDNGGNTDSLSNEVVIFRSSLPSPMLPQQFTSSFSTQTGAKLLSKHNLPLHTMITFLACSLAELVVHGTSFYPVLLLDPGSTNSYISSSMVKQMQPRYLHTWRGRLGTLTSSQEDRRDVYEIFIKDVKGRLHKHQFMETRDSSLGVTHEIPEKAFAAMCGQYNLPTNIVQNIGSEIAGLLGLDAIRFLLHKVETKIGAIFPDVLLFSTPLWPQFVLCGVIKAGIEDDDVYNTLSFLTHSSEPSIDEKLNHYIYTIHSSSSNAKKSIIPVNKVLNPVICKSHNNCENAFIIGFDFISHQLQKSLILDLIYFPMLSSMFKSSRNLSSSSIPWCARSCDSITMRTNTGTEATVLPSSPSTDSSINSKDELYHSNISFSYLKQNPMLSDFMDSGQTSAILCRTCLLRSKGCPSCKYSSSAISMMDVKNLNILRESLSIIEENGKERILLDFPMKENTMQYFQAKFSNRKTIVTYMQKLKNRLILRNFLGPFHQQIRDAVRDNHIEVFHGYTDDLSVQLHLMQNYVMKDSVSQPVRLTSNSNTCNLSKHSVNDCIIQPPAVLNIGVAVLTSWRLLPVAVALDIKRFYRSVHCTEKSNNLRLIQWYDTDDVNDIINNKVQLTTHRYRVLTYGDTISASASEVSIRSIVAEKCTDEESKRILKHDRIVDDVIFSCTDVQKSVQMVKSISGALSHYGFDLKFVIKTGERHDEDAGVLGVKWNTFLDTFRVNTELNCSTKYRGLYSKGPITPTTVYSTPLSRTVLARYCGQAYSLNGVPLAPVQATLRIMYGIACSYLSDWKTGLDLLNKKLDSQFKSILATMTNLKKDISPFSRAIIPAGFKLTSINIAGDSGAYAYGCNIYFTSHSYSDDTWYSTLVYSRSKLHKYRLPQGETASMVFALKTLSEMLNWSVFTKYFDEISQPVTVNLLSDSLIFCNYLNPLSVHTEVQTRNLIHSWYRIANDIITKYNYLKITVQHICSQNNSADKISKIFRNPVKQCNDLTFRHGNDCFKSHNWPPLDKIFLCIKYGSEPVYKKPVIDKAVSVPVSPEDAELIVEKANSPPSLPPVSDLKCNFSSVLAVITRSRARSATQLPSPSPPPAPSSTADIRQQQPPVHADPAPTHLTPPDSSNNYGENIASISIPTISSCLYNTLFNRSSNLTKIFNILIICYKWRLKEFRKLQYDVQSYFAFLTIIKSHQGLFPMEKTNIITFRDDDGILRLKTRLGEHDNEMLNFSHCPPVVNNQDSRLAHLLILMHHTVRTVAFGSPIHVGTAHTLMSLKQGTFGIHLTRAKQMVINFIKKCHVCVTISAKPATVQVGHPRWCDFISDNKAVFCCISADPVGPLTYFRNSEPTPWYCLVISCLLTRSSNLLFLEDLKHQTILKALRQHVAQYGRFSRIYTDCASNVYPRINGQQWISYFGNNFKPQVIRLQKGHQHLNYVEAISIKTLKRFLRSSFLQDGSIRAPENVTIQDILLALDIYKFVLNSRPLYSDEHNYVLTPNNVLMPSCFSIKLSLEEQFQELSLQQNALHLVFDKIKVSTQIFIKFLKQQILLNDRNKKLKNEKRCVNFLKNDVVIILRKRPYLGIVKQSGPQFCIVLSSEESPPTTFNVHNQKLILLFRSDNPKDHEIFSDVTINASPSKDKRRGFISSAMIRTKPLI